MFEKDNIKWKIRKIRTGIHLGTPFAQVILHAFKETTTTKKENIKEIISFYK